MRILMLTPRFPYPPDRGDTVRSWTILEGLTRRHEVWLACVDRESPASEHLQRVRDCCRDVCICTRSALAALWQGGRSMLAGHSLTAGYFLDHRLMDTLRHWSEQVDFDALYTYSSAMGPLAAVVRARRRVLDLCDVDSLKWDRYARHSTPPARWFYRREAQRVALLERRVARMHDLCILVNHREQAKFKARVADVPTDVMPTAINVADYAPPNDNLPSQPVVGMVGSMFYPPNVRAVTWFGRYVWPRVQAEIPEARWLIVGARPTRAVRRWAQVAGITVTGYVDDIRSYLHAMRVVANAVDNDLGVQSKLIIAMAAGRPAVVTPQAAAGLTYDDPPPFVISSSPSGFAAGVIQVLRDTAYARALATRARRVATEHYSAAAAVAAAEGWLTGAQVPASTLRSVAREALLVGAGPAERVP